MLSSRPIHIPTDGAHFPLKTPGRTKNSRAENAVGPMTVGRVGGKAMGLKTPFAGGSTKPKAQTVLRPKPLGDKTPFPNRVSNIQNFQTPGDGGKLKQLFADKDGTEEISPRASATRKSARAPRKSLDFKTPMNDGRHWDVSDLDIDVHAIREEAEVKETEEDWGEVEYCPPNNLHLLYDPPIDTDLYPDYREVGKTLKQMRYVPWMNDYEPPEIEVKPEEVQAPSWEDVRFELKELENDDIFAHLHPKPAAQPAAPKAGVTIRAGAGKPVATRPATNGAAPRPGAPNSRIARPAARPGTSAAATRPAPAPTSAAARPRAATTAGRAATVAPPTRSSTRTTAASTTRPGATSLSRGTSVANSRAPSSSRLAVPSAKPPASKAASTSDTSDEEVPVLSLDISDDVEDFIFDV